VNQEEKDREKLRRRFPTLHARQAADKLVDKLPVSAPMSTYTDVWLAAYRSAGGKEKHYADD
jgi:hypothetical protein